MKKVFLFLLLATTSVAYGQRFDYVYERNAWNGGVNLAGLRQDTLTRSYAEIYATKEKGSFVDPSASNDAWTAGLGAETIKHLKRISFYGAFNYDYKDQRNMCGSMFVDPGYYPVDILEFTPGRKILENYAFAGGLSAQVATHWTLGLKIDFAARNYAKRKDLRHKNSRLDFEIAPSVLYTLGQLNLGLSYIFDKNSECVDAEQINMGVDQYPAFFDKGLYYGISELWNGDGMHLDVAGVKGFPIMESAHGVGFQLSYDWIYADVAYRYRSGETGEKGFRWHEFSTDDVQARVVATLNRQAPTQHFVRLDFDWQSQLNNENVLDKVNIGGVTNVTIYGSTPIFGRKSYRVSGEYEMHRDKMELRAGAIYSVLNRQSTLMYPMTRSQELHTTKVYASGLITVGRWDLSGGLSYLCGGFSESQSNPQSDMTLGKYPTQLTEYYNLSNEYLTASRIGVEGAVRCNIHKFYIDLRGFYERGFSLRYLPSANHGSVTLAVGYNF